MENKPYYVLLTGSKNNAGDFLIKYRAKQLFQVIRPDRNLVDIDAWKERDDQILKTFNEAQAIILMGGPALVPDMYPRVYNVLGDIDDIKVPIVTMAVGWRAFPGEWAQTYGYTFSEPSLKLLKRIESSGFQSGVRDYHTLNVLLHNGFRSFVMTGCAALNDLDFIGKLYPEKPVVNKVAFSLGVAFTRNEEHAAAFKKIATGLRDKYKSKQFDVAFHHSLDEAKFHEAYKRRSKGRPSHFYERHVEFTRWLQREGISFTDISGSAENLINYYNQVDLHVGYRVHAHIYMSSVNRLSLLISEDGRGKAQRDVMNGLVLDSEFLRSIDIRHSWFIKRLMKLKLVKKAFVNRFIAEDVLANLSYEESTDFDRIKRTRAMIDSLHIKMTSFLKQLP
jgi:Polysaccharide pyruvyl transferase